MQTSEATEPSRGEPIHKIWPAADSVDSPIEPTRSMQSSEATVYSPGECAHKVWPG